MSELNRQQLEGIIIHMLLKCSGTGAMQIDRHDIAVANKLTLHATQGLDTIDISFTKKSNVEED